MLWQIKNIPVYILFTNISEVVIFYHRCTTPGLNKPKHSGDVTKRFPFLTIRIGHFGLVFFKAHKEIIFIYFEYISL